LLLSKLVAVIAAEGRALARNQSEVAVADKREAQEREAALVGRGVPRGLVVTHVGSGDRHVVAVQASGGSERQPEHA
jgi:hypothetical protein